MIRKSLAIAFTVATTFFTGAEARAPWLFFNFPAALQMIPVEINGHNAIVGTEVESSDIHAFLRTPDGTLTIIDPPDSIGAFGTGINLSGTTVGYYAKADNITHSFIRDAAGNYQTVDVPGGDLPELTAINDAGTTTGHYSIGGSDFGFVRKPDGSITTFNPPASHLISPVVIDNKGRVAGWFIDNASNRLSFVRDRPGNITVFSVAGAAETTAQSMNEKGEIVGEYRIADSNSATHGFLRAADGTITTFDVSGPGIPAAKSTQVAHINYLSQMSGCFEDAANVWHGFVRDTDGTFIQLDAPGATSTCVTAIGANGKVAGYTDTLGAFRLNRKGWKAE